MNNSSFEEILEKEGRLVYYNVGDSMLPLIRQGRDLVVIERTSGRLKKYDVPLFRRPNGTYVLHRIVWVRNEDYVVRGDNRWHKETGVRDEQILGVLTSVIRDGKELSVRDPKCRVRVRIWRLFFPLRAFWRKMNRVWNRPESRKNEDSKKDI